jgi:HNH endonuclease
MFISEAAKKTVKHGLIASDEGYMKVPLGYDKRRRDTTMSEYCHRLVLYFIFGPSPPSSQGPWECCHICCNKSCLNPFHLVWGTRKHNLANLMADYIDLAKEQGHPEDTIPRERPTQVS